jgi:COP9 signalosome complex subunit 4
MESKLAQFASLSQKDKAPAYLSLLPEILSRSNPSAVAADLRSLVDTVVNQESVGLVVGRQVLSELVKSLGNGAIKDNDLRKCIVEDTLATVQPRITSYEEQVSMPRFQIHLVGTGNDPEYRSILYGSNWLIYWKKKKNGAKLLEF